MLEVAARHGTARPRPQVMGLREEPLASTGLLPERSADADVLVGPLGEYW